MAVYAWGFAKLGQLGTDALEASLTPIELKIPVSDDRVAQIYTGGLFTALVTQKGDLYVCGCGRHGRLGTGSEDDVFSLTKIELGKDTKVGQVS